MRDTGIALRDVVMTGAVERFRSVVMTAIVATGGMMPAALATGVGSDVQRGLATMGGGRADPRHGADTLHPSDVLLCD